MRFGLIGDGQIARYHRKAIEYVGEELAWVFDPKYENCPMPDKWVDYAVICSPSQFHRKHILSALLRSDRVICEKPCCLPWETLVDDDRINVVLQYRWAPLPRKARNVRVTMIRDAAYFDSWKGNPRLTGGFFFNLFIHYIDLAIQLGADFHGLVAHEGKQERWVDDIDLFQFDIQALYNRMYEAILNGYGVKPSELFYLHYIMERCSRENGFNKALIGKEIHIPNQLL